MYWKVKLGSASGFSIIPNDQIAIDRRYLTNDIFATPSGFANHSLTSISIGKPLETYTTCSDWCGWGCHWFAKLLKNPESKPRIYKGFDRCHDYCWELIYKIQKLIPVLCFWDSVVQTVEIGFWTLKWIIIDVKSLVKFQKDNTTRIEQMEQAAETINEYFRSTTDGGK